MSYASVMTSLNKIGTIAAVSVNSSNLIETLEEMGFDEIEIIPLDDGFALHIGGTRIAVGVSDDPIEASENLLDRAADLFYYDVIEA